MASTPTFDLFLSYNRRDAAAVERMAGALEARGLRPYKDDWYLSPGSHWPSALERRLADCKGVVVAISGRGSGGRSISPFSGRSRTPPPAAPKRRLSRCCWTKRRRSMRVSA